MLSRDLNMLEIITLRWDYLLKVFPESRYRIIFVSKAALTSAKIILIFKQSTQHRIAF